jgi:hypothetical protein
VCYYVCMICAIYSGILFCILNNELLILDRLGIKKDIKRSYKIKPKNSNIIYYYGEHEMVGKKYLGFREKMKIIDNIIKIGLTVSFFFSILGIIVK